MADDATEPQDGANADQKAYPVLCPMCGGTNLSFDLADWFAHSLDPHDLHNTAELTETQCKDCGVAFWN